MPSLVVSLDIQAPLKASHKVGDLAEAWSGCTNRQAEIIHAKHANKNDKRPLNTHTHKVGDLGEAWYGCTNRQVEIAGCIHAKHANKRIQLKRTNKE